MKGEERLGDPPSDYESDNDALGDEADEDEARNTPPISPANPHPLDRFSSAELEQALDNDPESLGSVSLGRPNGGRLFNGVRMPEDEAWALISPKQAYGTDETVRALAHALRRVYERFPDTPAVPIGHLSAQNGGFLRPHRSHQSGRDVDIGIYYQSGKGRWYARAKPDNLDLERTTYLLQVLVEDTDIEMVLLDRSLHQPLRQYATSQGMDPDWIEQVFDGRAGRPAILRHASGHATHLHLRFRNPIARRSAERLASLLDARQILPVPPRIVTHVARTGDTLAKLAQRYGTTMRAIRQCNRMPSTQLVAGRTYEIPVAHSPSPTKTRSAAANRSNARK